MFSQCSVASNTSTVLCNHDHHPSPSLFPSYRTEILDPFNNNSSFHLLLCASALPPSHVRLFATLWAVPHQAPLSMGFSNQENWSGLPSPPAGDLPDLRIKPSSPALAGRFFTTEPPGTPHHILTPWQLHSAFCFCDVIILSTSCKWHHTVFLFLWLVYFTWHNILNDLPYCSICQNSLPFKSSVIFHYILYTNLPHFVVKL